MAKTCDYYAFLGVPRNATLDQIKKVWRKRVWECHPDHHLGDKSAEKLCKFLNKIWAILSNPSERKKYDEVLRQAENALKAKVSVPPHSTTKSGGTVPPPPPPKVSSTSIPSAPRPAPPKPNPRVRITPPPPSYSPYHGGLGGNGVGNSPLLRTKRQWGAFLAICLGLCLTVLFFIWLGNPTQQKSRSSFPPYWRTRLVPAPQPKSVPQQPQPPQPPQCPARERVIHSYKPELITFLVIEINGKMVSVVKNSCSNGCCSGDSIMLGKDNALWWVREDMMRDALNRGFKVTSPQTIVPTVEATQDFHCNADADGQPISCIRTGESWRENLR